MPTDMDTWNIQPFLDMLAVSELGRAQLTKSDNGYNVLVGRAPTAPLLFHSYADHPRSLMEVHQKNGAAIPSTAAGYGQNEHSLDYLRVYAQAGGVLA